MRKRNSSQPEWRYAEHAHREIQRLTGVNYVVAHWQQKLNQ